MWWCCSLWMSLCSNWKRIFFFLCISSHQKCFFFLLKEQPSFSLFTISIFCLEQFRVNSFMLETMMKWSGNTAVFKICASKFIFCNLYTATVVIVILESDFWDFFFWYDSVIQKVFQQKSHNHSTSGHLSRQKAHIILFIQRVTSSGEN